jgi:2-succinyl-6-hydroxy-2,4-cyclohexadiene-1-carboxylate synthase
MSDYTIDGFRYYVSESGSGMPVVLLHGFTGSSENWLHLAERLSRRFRVLVIDLPGHGRTDAPEDVARYRFERVADDLIELLERANAGPAHWLGYSMGGRLALYLAARHPQVVRSLILESGSPGIVGLDERAARRAQDEALAERILKHGIPAFVDYWQNIPLFWTQERLPAAVRDELRAQRLKNSTIGLANSLVGMGTGAQPELWSQLAHIHAPAQLIAGELDEKFVDINHRMAAALPNARFNIVANVGHAVHVEHPDEFERLIMAFLSEDRRQNLPDAKKGDKDEGRDGHLLEPGVQAW